MKAGTFTKFWAVLMTLVVIAVAILAGVWFSNGTLTYNGGGEDEEEPVAVAEDGSELVSGGTVPMQNMTFKSAKTLATGADAQNEEYASVTLTATVTPSWATQDLSWSVAFNDPASEWATGKTVTDYVTVTPGETTLTATVQCLQPFGEQIIVTVSADEFDDVSATCTVDFQRRVVDATFLFTDAEGEELTAHMSDGVIQWKDGWDLQTNVSFTIEEIEQIGTVGETLDTYYLPVSYYWFTWDQTAFDNSGALKETVTTLPDNMTTPNMYSKINGTRSENGQGLPVEYFRLSSAYSYAQYYGSSLYNGNMTGIPGGSIETAFMEYVAENRDSELFKLSITISRERQATGSNTYLPGADAVYLDPIVFRLSDTAFAPQNVTLDQTEIEY